MIQCPLLPGAPGVSSSGEHHISTWHLLLTLPLPLPPLLLLLLLLK
jgi:hypothetical protein